MNIRYVSLDWASNYISDEIKKFLFDNDITIVSDDTTSEFPEVTLKGTEENLCKFHKEWYEDGLSDAEWFNTFQ